MKFRIISDLHIGEYWHPFELEVMEDEKNTVLLIAGDAGEQVEAVEDIQKYCDRFQEVLCVMGNHEYCRGNMVETVPKIEQAVNRPNFKILDMGCVDYGSVVVIGATLWTDIANEDPLMMMSAKDFMLDYKCIRLGPKPNNRLITSAYTVNLHRQHLEYIKAMVSIIKDTGKKILIMTHHAPSSESVGERFIGHSSNAYFHSNLDEYIMDQPIDVWVHGHMHNSSDYKIGNTRVICNPRGYQSSYCEEKTNFNSTLTIEL